MAGHRQKDASGTLHALSHWFRYVIVKPGVILCHVLGGAVIVHP